MKRVVASVLTGSITGLISSSLGHGITHPLRWVLLGLSIILVQVIIKEN